MSGGKNPLAAAGITAALLCLFLTATSALAQAPDLACAAWQPGCVRPVAPIAPNWPPPLTFPQTTICYPTGDGPSLVVCNTQ